MKSKTSIILIGLIIFLSCSNSEEPDLEIDRDTEEIVTDIEGNEYSVVEILGRKWLQGNLRVTKFNDGTPLPEIIGNEDWIENNGPAFTWPLNGTNSNNVLGKLYNWEAAVCCNICPEGYRLPMLEEFERVRNYLGEFFLNNNNRPFVLHGSLGAGIRSNNGQFENSPLSDESLHFTGFWTSDLTSDDTPLILQVIQLSTLHETAKMSVGAIHPNSGISIKCINDM